MSVLEAVKKPFDLVLMDWKMPGMDGIETAARIKAHSDLTKIPAIIMVTAYGREEVMRLSDNVGLEGFLLKPVNASILFDAVMQAMGGQAEAGKVPREVRDQALDLAPIAGARILLVEDNEINQQVAREILEGAGLRVTVADNGQEGVAAANAGRYDAVLMDIQMPVMDGYAAARKIREWEKSQRSNHKSQITNPKSPVEGIPIIAMTAHAMTGDAEKSLAAGMNGHVTKPIDPDQLFAALVEWIAPNRGPAEDRPAKEADTANVVSLETDLPETLKGFDLAEGLTRLQGNRPLYRKLILTFADSCRQSMGAIHDAIESKYYTEVLQQAHSIKGSAGNLAAKGAQNAAMALEHLVKDSPDDPPPTDALRQALDKLSRAADIVFASVDALDAMPRDAVVDDGDMTGGIPADDLAALASRISEAAEMGDVTELQAIAAELDAQFGPKQPLSRKIASLADDFDLDGLGALADELAGAC